MRQTRGHGRHSQRFCNHAFNALMNGCYTFTAWVYHVVPARTLPNCDSVVVHDDAARTACIQFGSMGGGDAKELCGGWAQTFFVTTEGLYSAHRRRRVPPTSGVERIISLGSQRAPVVRPNAFVSIRKISLGMPLYFCALPKVHC